MVPRKTQVVLVYLQSTVTTLFASLFIIYRYCSLFQLYAFLALVQSLLFSNRSVQLENVNQMKNLK